MQTCSEVQPGTYLLLLEKVQLVTLHAKVGITIQQGLGARVGVVTGHDHHLQLHCLSTLLTCLLLQSQDALNVYLRQLAKLSTHASCIAELVPFSSVQVSCGADVGVAVTSTFLTHTDAKDKRQSVYSLFDYQ